MAFRINSQDCDQKFAKKCRDNSLSLKNNLLFTDIVLKTRDDQQFHVHKVVLASASPYFTGLFQNNPNHKPIILASNVSGKIMDLIINYMYTSSITCTPANYLELNQYANEFQLTHLRDITLYLITDSISEETCLDYWHHSTKMQLVDLKKKCVSFACGNPREFFEQSLEKLNYDEFIEILSKSNCSDDDRLEAIIKWCKLSYNERRWYLEELLNCVENDRVSEEGIQKLEDDDQLKDHEIVWKFVKTFYSSKIRN